MSHKQRLLAGVWLGWRKGMVCPSFTRSSVGWRRVAAGPSHACWLAMALMSCAAHNPRAAIQC